MTQLVCISSFPSFGWLASNAFLRLVCYFHMTPNNIRKEEKKPPRKIPFPSGRESNQEGTKSAMSLPFQIHLVKGGICEGGARQTQPTFSLTSVKNKKKKQSRLP